MASASNTASFDLGFSRFKSTSEDKWCKILEDRNCESTNKVAKHMRNILEAYIFEKDLPSFDQTLDAALPALLEHFYTDLRQKNRQMYKLQSLKCILAGLNRFIKEQRGIDIITDSRFHKTNEMFKGMAKVTCKAGLGSTSSFPPIPDEDLECLITYFYQDFEEPNPRKLQQAVIFSLMFHTCRRGRENMHEMKPDTYCVEHDAQNCKFVQLLYFWHYFSCFRWLLVPCKPLWTLQEENPQQTGMSVTKTKEESEIYRCCLVWQSLAGCQQAGTFMKDLSNDAGLSAVYTNHSIRATCITSLDAAGFESHHIMSISSHKSKTTVCAYAKKCPENKKFEMSEALSTKITSPAAPVKKLKEHK